MKLRVAAYGATILATAAAFLLRISLSDLFGAALPYITFYPVVMLAAFLGGLGPGLMATVVAGGLAVYFLPPQGQILPMTIPDVVGLGFFLGIGALVSFVAQIYQRNRGRLAEYEKTVAVQEKESHFRAFFDNAAVGAVQIDGEGRFVQVNDRFCQITGYSREELLGGMAASELTHADDRPTDSERHARFLNGETPVYQAEKRYNRKDGQVIWGRVTAGLIRDTHGRPVLTAAIVEDITARREAEAEREQLLTEVERRAKELEAVIHSMADGVAIYNAKGEIVRINPAAERITGFRPVDFPIPIAERWSKVRIETPEGQAVPLAQIPVFRALRGEIVQGETMVLHLSGKTKTVWISISAAPIRIGEEIIGAVAAYTDITRVRQMQQEREAFLHTITHDLRGPLTVILGHAELLAPEIDRAGLGEMPEINIRSILLAGQQMAKMMEDLVDIAQLEGGKLKVESEPIDLPAFFADYLKRSQVAMEISRVKIEVAPGLRPVFADPRNLERILGNLLGNALKYSEDSVTVAAVAAAGEKIVISVADNGPGIPPEAIPRVFDRFFRAEGAKGEGLGLGLYITRTLVEAQGGRIWVESRPGEGSTFSFSLPSVQ